MKKREFKINNSGISGWIESANGSSNNFLCYNISDIFNKDVYLDIRWDFVPSKQMVKIAETELRKFHKEKMIKEYTEKLKCEE